MNENLEETFRNVYQMNKMKINGLCTYITLQNTIENQQVKSVSFADIDRSERPKIEFAGLSMWY